MNRCSWSVLGMVVAALVLLIEPPPATGMVIRHDREDARYRELGARFPAAVTILPDGMGVLIAPDWVLTAAHVASGVAGGNLRVRTGDQERRVAEVFIHPGWEEMGPKDIALLRLQNPITQVEPVLLYEDEDEIGREIVFVGAGDTGTGLTGPKLQDGILRGATNVVEGADPDWLFFTFDQGEKATDLEGVSGPGDSGGPALLIQDETVYTLGVSVFSDGKGKGPGRYGILEGYTRVSSHVGWIRSVMSKEEDAKGSGLPSGFLEKLEEERAALIEIRRGIHRYPEASGEEARTARVVAEYLEASGFQVRTGVGGHGVVARLEGSAPGPVVAFRADMDAVRSGAQDPMGFRSEVEGVNHICGHDIHTAVGLALAAGFSGIREHLAGSVLLIFQPAEETTTGARAMLEDGVFGEMEPDVILAYHTAPLEVGQVAGTPGTLLPGRDAVRVTIDGDGDLQETAGRVREIVMAAATEGSNEPRRPMGDPFVRVDGARATRDGEGWLVRATLTTASREASAGARDHIQAALTALERDGLEIDLDYRERFVAGVENDADVVERADAVFKTVLGEDAVFRLENLVTQFSEDYGSFLEHVPGAMYFLGVSNSASGWVGMPHSPTYVADEEAIFTGARAMAAVFLDFFADPEGIGR